MIRKLLLFVRSLFSLFPNSSKEKSFTLSLRLICLGMFFVFSTANATTYYTSVNGSPSTLGNWWTNMNGTGGNPANFTTPGDIFIIQNGDTMTTTAAWSITGSLQIATGGSLVVVNHNITISGTTTISGTLQHSNNTGTKIYVGLVTVNSGGTWNNSSNVGVTFRGGITNNGTFTSGTGIQTFDTNAQVLNGTISISRLTANIGVSNNGTLTVSNTLAGSSSLTNNSGATLNINTTNASGITSITNSGTATINASAAINTVTANFVNTSTGTLNISGSSTIAGITNNGTANLTSSGTITTFNNATAASQLNITATTTPITNLTATVAGNTVNYNGTTQTIKGTTYSNLILSTSGTKTLGAATTNTNSITLNNDTSLAMSTFSLTLSGNLINNGNGTISGTTGGVTISGTSSQSVAGFTTTGTVLMNKTGNTATLTGNINGAAFTINGSGGTLNLGTGLSHTFTGNVTLTAGTLNGGSSTLNVNSTSTTAWGGTGTNFNAGTSTVNFGGANQTLSSSSNTFYNLYFTGSGNKIFSAATNINNIFSIASGVKASLSTFVHNAAALVLAGSTKTASSYGGSGTSGTITDTNSFNNGAGRVVVTTDSCLAFSGVAQITSVKLNTLDSTPLGTTSYENIPSTTATTTVTKGDYYSLVIKGNTNGDYNMYYTAFFDWNGDGDFVDPDEGPISIGTIRNSSGADDKATSAYFRILPGATGTNIAMRIIGLRGNTPNSTPCTVNSGIGQVKDYTISLQSNCVGPLPVSVSTNSTASTVCPNVPFTLSLGNTFGEGATYLWQTSPTSTGPWTGAATPSIAFYNNDFSTAQGLNTTVGDVSVRGVDTQITGGELILTTIAPDGHNGGFFIDKANTDNINPFTATFKYKIDGGGAVGADGLSLSYGPGFVANEGGGEGGEGSGLRIQFDTYDNEDVATGSRVRIVYNNASIFNAGINDPINLRTTTYKDVKLYVDTDGYLSLAIQDGAAMVTIVSKLLLPNYSTTDKSTWKFKFSARTGGLKDIHSIDDLVITFLDSANSKSKFTTSQTVKTYYRAVITCGTSSVNSTPVFVDMSSAVITTQPTVPAAVCSGTGVRTISVAATGLSLAYTWKKDGVDLVEGGVVSGQGTNTLTLTSPTAANAGNYTVVVTGACSSSVTSNAVALTVNALPTPTFTASPSSPVCADSDVTYTTEASQTNYIWTVPGTAGTDYNITGGGIGTGSNTVTLRWITSGSKTVSVNYTNSNGCTATSATSSTINVNALPIITAHPQPIAVCEGKNHIFTVVTSAGSPTYQWQYSPDNATWTNTDLAGGVTGHTSASLNVTGIPLSYSGNYVHCIITVGTCSITSNSALLTVNPTPTAPTASVTTQPTCAVPTATITVSSPAPAAGITYSIDGTTYNTTGIFSGVATGSSYNVTTKNSSGCESPITVVSVNAYAGKTWNGSLSTNWNVAGNWTPNGVPTVDDCVVIPDLIAITNKPEITGTNTEFKAHTINLNNNSSFIVRSTNTLTVTNAVTVNTGSTLTFENNASLVQTTNAVNSGNITYLRSTTPINRYDYVYWSVPVTATPGITLHDLSPTTLADKYQSFNPSSGWVISYNGTQVMTPGQGYIVRGPQENASPLVFQASFTGVPNNGDFTITPVATKWHLIGNPYPSAISANKLITDAGTGALYFWSHTNQPDAGNTGNETYNYDSDDYSVYTLSGSTGPSNGPPASGKIAAGQGFFFKASTGSDVVFTNSMRIPGDNSQFFKTAGDIERNRVWLNMSTTTGLFKQVLVGYIEGATNSWDQNYDAATLNGNTYVDFYSISDAKKLTIQGRELPFEDTDLVPLGYKTAVAGEFTIAIDHTDGLLNSQAVYLEDKTNGTIYDLKAGNYKFTTEIGTFTDRFVLRYTNKTLGTGDFENVKDGLLVSVKDKVIKVTSSKENIKEVAVFDVTGKLLYNKKKVGATELSISNLQAAEQVLLVKVTLENKAEVTRKIIFK
ncbi:T9SS sorting signal type C domain-containing protein [Flavobacterium sp. UBA7680]|uniref:T9SS sorting signal type C domain-containing protein n=1 Tax=Flavobacterium sp. UBA7680 TaxID=1946559 RepID=UPI0025C3F0D4|nr:T9SS sorting signal type C domain-containing protein [Flavobacterium sp. UBA7680]